MFPALRRRWRCSGPNRRGPGRPRGRARPQHSRRAREDPHRDARDVLATDRRSSNHPVHRLLHNPRPRRNKGTRGRQRAPVQPHPRHHPDRRTHPRDHRGYSPRSTASTHSKRRSQRTSPHNPDHRGSGAGSASGSGATRSAGKIECRNLRVVPLRSELIPNSSTSTRTSIKPSRRPSP